MEVVAKIFEEHALDGIVGPTAGLTAPPLSDDARATGVMGLQPSRLSAGPRSGRASRRLDAAT